MILGAMVAAYLAASFTPIGAPLSYPVEILAAFLHEFGHASATLLTGGKVLALQINPDGSGVTISSGGNHAVITMGGYIGSCFFSNFMVRASLSQDSRFVCYLLALVAVFSGVFWFSNLTNLFILVLYAFVFILISRVASSLLLQFIGIACLIHILQDFRVGPSGDLQQFESAVGIFPYSVWMWIWLGIAVLITVVNIKLIIKYDSKA